MHLLIDADVLVYQIGFASQKTLYHGTSGAMYDCIADARTSGEEFEPEIVVQPKELVDHFLKQTLDSIVNTVEPSEFTLCLSGKGNYRNDIAVTAPYKGHRREVPKPVYYDYLRGQLAAFYGKCKVSTDEEADDVMGYSQCAIVKDDPYGACIATIDKDLDMIPGPHYNWSKASLYTVNDLEAGLTFYHQLLTGDSTDNIAGIPGIGPAKAKKALKGITDEESIKTIIRAMYQDYYAGEYEEKIDEMGKLLWIRREPDQLWDFSLCCLG